MGETVSHIIALDAVHHMFLSVCLCSERLPLCNRERVVMANPSKLSLRVLRIVLIQDYLKVYPNAKLVGPKGLVSKRSELHFDIVQPENELDAELAKEFKAVALTGHPNEVSINPHVELLF